MRVLLLSILVVGCATKVGNPENDKDAVDTTEAELLALPDFTGEFKIPENDLSEENIDPAFQIVIKDLLAVGKVASSIGSQLQAFFEAMKEKKLKRNVSFSFDDWGKTITGKSWSKPADEALEDGERRHGVWFCDGETKLGYFTWGGEQQDIYFIRNPIQDVLIEDSPLVAGVDGMVEAVVSLDGSTLETYYLGERCDTDTFKSTGKDMVFQFSALVGKDGGYTSQGNLIELTDRTVLPEKGEIKVYAKFEADGAAQTIIHMDSLCPPFEPENLDSPKWCFGIEFSNEDAGISEEDADLIWQNIRNEKVLLPKREFLKILEFPAEMECPVASEE